HAGGCLGGHDAPVLCHRLDLPAAFVDILQPEGAAQGLRIGDGTAAAALQNLVNPHHVNMQEFVFVELPGPGCEAAGHEDMEHFIGIAHCQMHLSGLHPVMSAIPRFLEELSLRAHQGRFPGVEFAGRKLHDEPLYRVPVLPDHDDPLIVQKGDHHHRAGVAYVLAYALPSIGQAHRITPDLQKAAFVDRFTLEGGFGDVRYVTAHAQRSYSRGRVGITLVYGLDALQHILRQLDIDTVDVFLELIEVGGADE